MNKYPLFRLIWCAIGAFAAISLALWAVGPPETPFILASLGGSAIFLFGLTGSPAAQPRALFGGHIISAFIGIVSYQVFGDSILVYAGATAIALCVMLLTRTVHPPAGANPLLMVYIHAEWQALWQPVIVGVGCLFLVAVVWSRLYPKFPKYPVSIMEPSP